MIRIPEVWISSSSWSSWKKPVLMYTLYV